MDRWPPCQQILSLFSSLHMSHLFWHNYYYYCSGYVLQSNSWTWESLFLMPHTFHSHENKKGIKGTRSDQACRSERVSFRLTQIKGLWPSLSLKQPWRSLSHHSTLWKRLGLFNREGSLTSPVWKDCWHVVVTVKHLPQCLAGTYHTPPFSGLVAILCNEDLTSLRPDIGLPWWLSRKGSACDTGAAGDADSVSGSGRCPGGGNGNPA